MAGHAAREQCKATSASTGRRCRARAVLGMDVCRTHGGGTGAARDAAARRSLRNLTTMIPADDPEVDVYVSVTNERRRTIARIRYFDDRIAELAGPEDLIWGKAEETDVRSGQWPGLDTTHRAEVNMYYVLQQWEREHLAELDKLVVRTNLAARHLALNERYGEAIATAVRAVLSARGLDPDDDVLRADISRELAAVERTVVDA